MKSQVRLTTPPPFHRLPGIVRIEDPIALDPFAHLGNIRVGINHRGCIDRGPIAHGLDAKQSKREQQQHTRNNAEGNEPAAPSGTRGAVIESGAHFAEREDNQRPDSENRTTDHSGRRDDAENGGGDSQAVTAKLPHPGRANESEDRRDEREKEADHR